LQRETKVSPKGRKKLYCWLDLKAIYPAGLMLTIGSLPGPHNWRLENAVTHGPWHRKKQVNLANSYWEKLYF